MQITVSECRNFCRFILIVVIATSIAITYDNKNTNQHEKKYILNVCPLNNNTFLNEYYSTFKVKHMGDSGIDVIVPYDVTIPPLSTVSINYDTMFVLTDRTLNTSYSYYLFARSSMSKLNLVLINGVYIIDAGARVSITSPIYNLNNSTVTIKKGSRLVQICASDLSELEVNLNCNIPDYGTRGSNGFGSTGK